MSGVKDEHLVEEFSTEAADPTFHDRVCAGRPDRRRDDLYTLAGEDPVEHAGKLRVPVANQECELSTKVTEVHQQSACLLANPVCGGICGDAQDVYPAVGMFDDREAVQPGEEHGVAMEEVAGENSVCLAAQELGPGWAGASWGRIDSRASQDRPDREAPTLRPMPASSPAMRR